MALIKNVYIANPDWLIVPDFNAPEGFHAPERSWFIGALEHPGEVYITEPYLDADDGRSRKHYEQLFRQAPGVVIASASAGGCPSAWEGRRHGGTAGSR